MYKIISTLAVVATLLVSSSCQKENYHLAYDEHNCSQNPWETVTDNAQQKEKISSFLNDNGVKIKASDLSIVMRTSYRKENNCKGFTGRAFLIDLSTKEANKAIGLGFRISKDI